MIFNWILVNKLAIGTPCMNDEDYLLLKKKNIKAILDLRNNYDFLKLNNTFDYRLENQFKNQFKYFNYQLPDHNSKRLATSLEINKGINLLHKLILNGPVFMHCKAAVERSPLLSMAYLHKFHNLTILQALDYLLQQNKNTNISSKQLLEIKKQN